MFLLSFADTPDRIDCAALGRRKGSPRNTAAYNIEFDAFVFFTPPLRLSPLLERLPSGPRATIKDREDP